MDNSQVLQRSAIYLLVLVALPYGWWYFDPIAVFWVLLGLNLALTRHWGATALTAGIGIITKFFPGLVLASAWRRVSWKYLFIMLTISLIPTIFSYGILWQASPQFTMASFRSQADKGSWETIWALIDGNIRTGSLGPVEERLDPTNAGRPSGNPPTVPLFISLVPFAGIGLAGLVRVKSPGKLQSIAIVGFAWTLFLLWSPGWSPQWILYLLPLILLTLPLKQALLFGIVLVMNSLMEWPVLLSRGYFSFLWIPVVLRTFVLILLCITWGKMMLIDPDTRDSNK